MYDSTQPIHTPFGVSVFGSALLRVDPDTASLQFSVLRTENQPKAAFASARKATNAVRHFLSKAGITDVGASRVTLSQEFKYSGGEQRFIGYAAKVKFHIILTELDRVEEILIGVVDAGANEVSSVSFESRKLKELRALARSKAVEAAREKAQVYCEVAGVQLGAVVHIEDINPDILTGRNEGHVTRQVEPDDSGELTAFDPGAITVAGAVRVGYSFNSDAVT